MDKTYNFKDFEDSIYNTWLKKDYFKANINKQKTPFTIIMPPPNITSKLHMGHAFQQTIQDVIIRRKRMQGFEALWLPGTDHAAIATEAKVTEKLAKQGVTKEEIGREEFLKHINQWYVLYKDTIINQFKKMGFSCDWSRLAFTMDEQNSRAVREVFVYLYKKGWIYKGKRIVNWCSGCKSSISDAEVEYKTEKSHLWHLKYKIEGASDYLTLATTRPETMLGDTAVAVNPNDKRYKHLVGKNVILPILNKPIPIVADEYVEMDFGTGVVKMTPAHDPNDFEVAQRHNLEIIRILNDDGTMNDLAGKYAGLDILEARKQIVEELKKLGNLVKIEDYSHNVGHCDRCKTTVEPLISSQWFVKMDELAKPAINAVEDGSIKFSKERFKKIYLHWMYNLKDWCISRQLWSGHRIPIFICEDCGEVIVENKDPIICPKCGSKKLKQEEDTLDTWFSSALWPISTLGFPDKTKDLEYFYPTDVLVTGQEIIQLWVARMIFSGLEYNGDIPFKHVVINGTVKDAIGRKMSKSLGNGVDPVEIIEKYGVDTLRFSLLNGIAIDMDSRFSEKKVELSRNFINKVWNASRYVLMQLEGKKIEKPDPKKLSLADKWILTELSKTIKSIDKKFEKFDIGIAVSELYEFFWTKFCDWYIEASKCDLQSENPSATLWALEYVLTTLLKLLHPYIPFITEKIYTSLPNSGESIVISDWPTAEHNFRQEAKQFEEIMKIIKAIRNTRAGKSVPDNKKIKAEIFVIKNSKIYTQSAEYIKRLSLLDELKFVEENMLSAKSVLMVFNDCKIALPLENLIDEEKEQEKIKAEIEKIKFEISRSEKMLSNTGFVSKAPKSLIDAENEKLTKNKSLLNTLINSIK